LDFHKHGGRLAAILLLVPLAVRNDTIAQCRRSVGAGGPKKSEQVQAHGYSHVMNAQIIACNETKNMLFVS
jgi:hypothetical protein